MAASQSGDNGQGEAALSRLVEMAGSGAPGPRFGSARAT